LLPSDIGSDPLGVRTFSWTGSCSPPQAWRYSAGLGPPSETLMRFWLYRLMYRSTTPMNSCMLVPCHVRLEHISFLRRGKKPSHASLSGVHAFFDMDRVRRARSSQQGPFSVCQIPQIDALLFFRSSFDFFRMSCSSCSRCTCQATPGSDPFPTRKLTPLRRASSMSPHRTHQADSDVFGVRQLGSRK